MDFPRRAVQQDVRWKQLGGRVLSRRRKFKNQRKQPFYTRSRNKRQNGARKLQSTFKPQGGAISDFIPSEIRRHFSVRVGLPPHVREVLHADGNVPVVGLMVVRVPLSNKINAALNAITLGSFGRQMKAAGYDSMFHLYLLAHLANRKLYRFERNEVITLFQVDGKMSALAERAMVPLPGHSVTLNELWNKAHQVDGDQIFVYDPVDHNCQNFVQTVLAGSGLLSAQLSAFAGQNAESLLPEYARRIGRWTTDLAAKFNHVYEGSGMRGGGYESNTEAELIALCTAAHVAYEDIDHDHPPDGKELTALHDELEALADECNRRVDELGAGPDLARWATDLEEAANYVDSLLGIHDYVDEGPPSPGGIFGSGRGGKYVHSSAVTRAGQEAAQEEEKKAIAGALVGHLNDIKSLVEALNSGDQAKATHVVMDLVGKVSPNPVTKAFVPVLTGLADLISGHTRADDPDYHRKIRSYMDDAFGAIPVVGPYIENLIAPYVEEKFRAPADTYTGRLMSGQVKGSIDVQRGGPVQGRLDGNLGLSSWKNAGTFWGITNADQKAEYDRLHPRGTGMRGGALGDLSNAEFTAKINTFILQLRREKKEGHLSSTADYLELAELGAELVEECHIRDNELHSAHWQKAVTLVMKALNSMRGAIGHDVYIDIDPGFDIAAVAQQREQDRLQRRAERKSERKAERKRSRKGAGLKGGNWSEMDDGEFYDQCWAFVQLTDTLFPSPQLEEMDEEELEQVEDHGVGLLEEANVRRSAGTFAEGRTWDQIILRMDNGIQHVRSLRGAEDEGDELDFGE